MNRLVATAAAVIALAAETAAAEPPAGADVGGSPAERARIVVQRWEEAQGMRRAHAEVFPRDAACEISTGDNGPAIKARFIDSGAGAYALLVQRPDGWRYGEFSAQPGEYWFVSDTLGLGRFSGTSDLVNLMRQARVARLPGKLMEQVRLPDFARDGRTFHVVGTKAVAQPVQFRLFDPERGTLVQVDTINDRRQVTERIRYGDFRAVDGMLEPFETVFGEGPQRVTIRTVKAANRFAPPPGFFKPSSAQVSLWQRTEDILKKYVAASGGYAALAQIVSRVTRIEVTNEGAGLTYQLTLSQKAPDFFLSEADVPGVGRAWQGFDGQTGWSYGELQGFRPIRGEELELFRRNGMLDLENFPKRFPIRRSAGVKEVNGRRTAVLELANLLQRTGLHYFDLETGQLLRIEAELDAGGEGRVPVTIDFSDFRAVDGVTLPFRTDLRHPAFNTVTRVLEVKQNVELDPAIFRPRKDE